MTFQSRVPEVSSRSTCRLPSPGWSYLSCTGWPVSSEWTRTYLMFGCTFGIPPLSATARIRPSEISSCPGWVAPAYRFAFGGPLTDFRSSSQFCEILYRSLRQSRSGSV